MARRAPGSRTQRCAGQRWTPKSSLLSRSGPRVSRGKEIVSAGLEAGLAVAPVHNADTIQTEPHYEAREMILTVEQPDGTLLKVPGAPIKMGRLLEAGRPESAPIKIAYPGEHTHAVLKEWLQLEESELDLLSAKGVIQQAGQRAFGQGA